jgi:hypothetical protein
LIIFTALEPRTLKKTKKTSRPQPNRFSTRVRTCVRTNFKNDPYFSICNFISVFFIMKDCFPRFCKKVPEDFRLSPNINYDLNFDWNRFILEKFQGKWPYGMAWILGTRISFCQKFLIWPFGSHDNKMLQLSS